MFETSFLLMIKSSLINILLPLIPWIIFLRIFYWKKIQWILLYIMWWFVWVWVIAFSIFNLQFIHYWIWIKEYLFILLLLVIIFITKIILKKISLKDYINTLKISSNRQELNDSYNGLPRIEKKFFILSAIFASIFLITTFVYRISFPTYWDDSFGNWNWPAFNIYQDWWVKLFGDKTEILWRWRLGYPIYIPVYKALISDFTWWFNDIYINMWQFLVFLGLILFVAKITRDKTKNVFYSILPIVGVMWLPLVFFHANEWYMELACAAYSILTIWSFWKFLEGKDYGYMSLALLLGFILSNIKNDWLLWYFAWIVIWFLIIIILKKEFNEILKGFIKEKRYLLFNLFYLIFFLLPFIIIKKYYNLWFNQSVSSEGGLWISSNIHTEVFNQFKPIFINMDNYNVVLIIVFIIWFLLYKVPKDNYNKKFLYITPMIILLIFILVFLLTENYIFAMNQTTINRVFTMAFVILLSFSWFLLYSEWKD